MSQEKERTPLNWEIEVDHYALFTRVVVAGQSLTVALGSVRPIQQTVPSANTFEWVWAFHLPRRNAQVGIQSTREEAQKELLAIMERFDDLPQQWKDKLFCEAFQCVRKNG